MMVIQEIQRFPNHIDTSAIAESMNGRIDKGWRVHSCLVRGAEVIIVYYKEAQDSIICLEKAYDELKEALKKKDTELKAVRHYFNECVEDLKKAHAEIERLHKEYNWLNADYLMQDIGIESVRAEAIKEVLDKVAVFCAESGLFHCEADEMLLFNYLDSLKMQAMLEANGMVGESDV